MQEENQQKEHQNIEQQNEPEQQQQQNEPEPIEIKKEEQNIKKKKSSDKEIIAESVEGPQMETRHSAHKNKSKQNHKKISWISDDDDRPKTKSKRRMMPAEEVPLQVISKVKKNQQKQNRTVIENKGDVLENDNDNQIDDIDETEVSDKPSINTKSKNKKNAKESQPEKSNKSKQKKKEMQPRKRTISFKLEPLPDKIVLRFVPNFLE